MNSAPRAPSLGLCIRLLASAACCTSGLAVAQPAVHAQPPAETRAVAPGTSPAGLQPAPIAPLAAPAPGTAQNPSRQLVCQRVPIGIDNGAGTGPGGVMQLVAAPSAMQLVTVPGLAIGGAWSANAPGTAGRTVNFNYSFSNLNTLLGTLTPRGALFSFDVNHANIKVHRGNHGGAAQAAALDLELPGSTRRVNWSDSVFDNPPGMQGVTSDDWLIVILLRGRASRVVMEDWQPFVARVHCQLPVER